VCGVSITLLRGNALALPLADRSVDLVITSPPYFAMRSYQDAGEHYAGQIGSEDNPHDFLDALLAATEEMVRVLKPAGSIWVNLGDKYCSPGGHTDNTASSRLEGRRAQRKQERADRATTGHGVRAKSLFGLPWRYALRCIDELGLILRAEVIWEKPNSLPESVTDRVRRSHEQWFHFVTQPRYFAAMDVIREPASGYQRNSAARATPAGQRERAMADTCNPLGRLPGSVWEVSTQPLLAPAQLGVDHYAAFPMEWPRKLIQGWTPPGFCTACGEGRRPVAERTPMVWRESPSIAGRTGPAGDARRPMSGTMLAPAQSRIVGYGCSCAEPIAPTTPAVVLDPFGGTGTTALVADALGRHGISVDMSGDYCRLAKWRTTDPGQRAAALQVEKPAIVQAGQQDLLDLIGEAS
jgi:DNA modification methylase